MKYRSLEHIIIFSVICIIISNFTVVSAQDSLNQSLLLPLDVMVTTFSKSSETISKTPRIVSSVTIEELLDYGVSTLKDALNVIPGVVVQEETLGTTTVMIRGLSDTWNQKTLFLLDGVPYWMPAQGEYPLLGMPLALIEKIEITRGPGSVLYGTNASGGIINIVLKKNKDEVQVLAKVGSLGTKNANFSIVKKNKVEGHWLIGGSFQHMNQGYEANYPSTILIPPFSDPNNVYINQEGDTTSFPTSGSHQKKESFANFTVGYKHKGLNVLATWLNQEQNGLGGVAVITHTNRIRYKGILAHADYTKRIDAWVLHGYFDHGILFHEIHADNFLTVDQQTLGDGRNLLTVNPIIFNFDKPYKNNYRSRYGLRANYTLPDNGNLFFGFESEHRSTGTYQLINAIPNSVVSTLGNSIKMDEFAIYSQLDYNWQKWRFVLGARYIQNSISGNRLNPRLSVIHNIDKKQSLKLLYAEGFNSPALLQQITLDIPFVIKGSSDIKAEVVHSLDLAYTYASSDRIFVANAYYFINDDIIVPQPQVVEDPERIDHGQVVDIYTNLSTAIKRWGIELDYQHYFKKVKLFANLTYNHQGNKISDDDFFARFVPQITSNLGLLLKINNQHSIGTNHRYIGTRGRENHKLSALNLINISYNLELKPLKITLTANNLLNQAILHPDVTRNTVPVVPGGARRGVFAILRWNIK